MGRKEREKARRRQEAKHTALDTTIVPPEGAIEYSLLKWIKRNDQKVKEKLKITKSQLQQEGTPPTRVAISAREIFRLVDAFCALSGGKYSKSFLKDFTEGVKLVSSALANGERTAMGLYDEDFSEEFKGDTPQTKQGADDLLKPLMEDVAEKLNMDPTGFTAVDYLCATLPNPDSPWISVVSVREYFVRGLNFANVVYKELYPLTEAVRLN